MKIIVIIFIKEISKTPVTTTTTTTIKQIKRTPQPNKTTNTIKTKPISKQTILKSTLCFNKDASL